MQLGEIGVFCFSLKVAIVSVQDVCKYRELDECEDCFILTVSNVHCLTSCAEDFN